MTIQPEELKEMIAEVAEVTKEDYTLKHFSVYAPKVITELFNYTKERVVTFYNVENFAEKFPTVILERRLTGVDAFYNEEKKSIHIARGTYESRLLGLIRSKKSAVEMTEYLEAKMLFSFLHELAHYRYYEINKDLSLTVDDVLAKFNVDIKTMSYEETSQNKQIEEIILAEALEIINSEESADYYAFKWMEDNFNEDFVAIQNEGYREKREQHYINYGKRLIRKIIEIGFRFHSKKEQELLIKKYQTVLSQKYSQ